MANGWRHKICPSKTDRCRPGIAKTEKALELVWKLSEVNAEKNLMYFKLNKPPLNR